MGYYITSQETDPVIIEASQFAAMLDALRSAEASTDSGTLSWLRKVDEYTDRHEDADRLVCYRRALVDIFTEFGLSPANLPDGADEATEPITLEYWDGEKMPWTWENVWNALGEVVTTPATWVIRGEDGELWAERVGYGKGHTVHGVALTVID